MSYRTFKRVLGETRLERKCRLIFGGSLLLLIGGAFWAVDRIAEDLVYQTTRQKGADLVDLCMFRYHFELWETDPDKKQLAQEMSRDLLTQSVNYKFEVLAPPGAIVPELGMARVPTDPEELQLVQDLLREVEAQRSAELARRAETGEQRQPDESLGGQPIEAIPLRELPGDTGREAGIEPKSEERISGNEYHYYQPVYWKKSCIRCHFSLHGAGSIPAPELDGLFLSAPTRVVKVVIPHRETQMAINQSRAILLAAAIVTVSIAMIALYAIVQYVIVKPLKHLRDVSDEVSRGKTELRADIHTNDEFEDLAASFNRMLRHLAEAQQKLRQANSELDAKVDQLAQANMKLYEMNRLKSDFLANMSHELRTPLNSILGFSDVLVGIDALNERQRRYVQNIRDSGRVLLVMINEILDLAKMEAGKMEVRPSEFDIGVVVAAQCDMVRSLTEEKNIDLAVHVDPELPPLYQDQTKVLQILTNLLSNAIKFTPQGGRITVSVQRTPDARLRLMVSDTGVGIAEEDHDMIFEKFRQGTAGINGSTLTREYSGTGLGLSIVRELSKLLGGEVDFESELGKGSTFFVILPWTCADRPRLSALMAARLDELTSAYRNDLIEGRGNTGDANGSSSVE